MAGNKSSNKVARLKEYRINEKDLKDLTLFKFKELEVATNYFSETNQLGRGGFGPVYKVSNLILLYIFMTNFLIRSSHFESA